MKRTTMATTFLFIVTTLSNRSEAGAEMAGVRWVYSMFGKVFSCVMPEYTFVFDENGSMHGLDWIVPIRMESKMLRHGLDLSIAYYPGDKLVSGRATYRVFFPKSHTFHFSMGLGGFINRNGGGPRVDLRMNIGSLELYSFFVSAAYEPNVARKLQGGEIGVGLEYPFLMF